MLISPSRVADYVIAFANEVWESLTHLKIQKIVYYAQAWYLANFWEPLFDEDFQAWVHWPVLRSLYNEYSGAFPWAVISKDISKDHFTAEDSGIIWFLEEICTVYMPYWWYELELMTHKELPWVEARQGLNAFTNSENTISKETIQSYYRWLMK